MNINIFYSWQSATDEDYNKKFIRKCIEKSLKKIQKKGEFKEINIELTDSIRGEAGSPPVADTILKEKVPFCDIFIADLTPINRINPVVKLVSKFFKSNIRQTANPNVIEEHGIAINAIGYDRIISVSNSYYGSISEDESNIHFDVRHLRHPIQYILSKKTKTNDKKNIEETLISNLSNAISLCVIKAIEAQNKKYHPFIKWSEWEKYVNKNNFYYNDKIKEIQMILESGLKERKPKSYRLLGLSGLGKTRLLFEIFKKKADVIGDAIGGRILYIDYNEYSDDGTYYSIFRQLIEHKENRILIIDNCPRNLHIKLLNSLHNVDNLNSIISVNSDPEEIHNQIQDTEYILIGKLDLDSVIDDILQKEYSFSTDICNRIKQFAQGIPLMAVLIGDNLKTGNDHIGRLTNTDLLNKLLGKKGDVESIENRRILQSLAIFDYFGYEESALSQFRTIINNTNITPLSGSSEEKEANARSLCIHYAQRGIFEKRGRYLSMRPIPLSMYLTQEWIKHCPSDRFLKVIIDIASLNEPDRTELGKSLVDQMRLLGYDDNAKDFVEKLSAYGAPFDNAEVLNTELGSRLFRSLVEVNPVAISNNFVRNFLVDDVDKLKLVVEGRRNIIWTLEKLCFDKTTFTDSMKVLYSFAIAENEKISNNATGQFLQIFHLFLAGTEADLLERWNIILWGFSKKDERFHYLAIKAMGVGLNYGYFNRMGGGEIQGSKTLKDYQPGIPEIVEYWILIITKLKELLENKLFIDEIADILVNKIRGIARSPYTSQFIMLLELFDFITQIKENNWDKGLEALKTIRKYEQSFLSPNELELLEKNIQKLTKNDFVSCYTKINDFEDFDHENYDASIKKQEKNARNLAIEAIESNVLYNYLPTLLTIQQPYGNIFGEQVAQMLTKESEKEFFLSKVYEILAIPNNEGYHLMIFTGFISLQSIEEKKHIYEYIKKDEKLIYTLPYLIAVDKDGLQFINLLLDLIESDKLNINCIELLTTYRVSIYNINEKRLKNLSDWLLGYRESGAILLFNLLYVVNYNKDNLGYSLLAFFKEAIKIIGFEEESRKRVDMWRYADVICKILENPKESEFAKFINESIINSIHSNTILTYHLDSNIKNIYSVLISIHFSAIWDNLSKALITQEYVKFYCLKNIFGSEINSYSRNPVSVLFKGNIEEIFKWCEENKPLAPQRLAELVPIFSENEEKSTWHPLSRRLIDDWGNIDEVLTNIDANMGSFSWTGSIVPYLESQRDLFIELENHPIDKVVIWAKNNIDGLNKSIKREQDRDDEWHFLY